MFSDGQAYYRNHFLRRFAQVRIQHPHVLFQARMNSHVPLFKSSRELSSADGHPDIPIRYCFAKSPRLMNPMDSMSFSSDMNTEQVFDPQILLK